MSWFSCGIAGAYGYIRYVLDFQQVNTPELPVERSRQLSAPLITLLICKCITNRGKGGFSVTSSVLGLVDHEVTQKRGSMLFHLPRITEVHVWGAPSL